MSKSQYTEDNGTDDNPDTTLQASAHELNANSSEQEKKVTPPEHQVVPVKDDQDVLSFMAQKAYARDSKPGPSA